MQTAGATLKIEVVPVEARQPSEFESAFQKIASARADGLVTAIDPLFFAGRDHLARLAIAQHLPSIHVNGDAVDAGFLMSYGANHESIFRRTPLYVDKILRGALPRDLPVEQPTQFEVCINLKTAKAIGLTIPPSVRLQAERVIE
jgi:putative ABC transport system substrate-binding protein